MSPSPTTDQGDRDSNFDQMIYEKELNPCYFASKFARKCITV